MIETSYRLDQSRSVTIGATGTAEVLGIGPQRANERWYIKLFNVKTGSTGQFQVFRGNDVQNANQIDFTGRADGDTSPCDIRLQSGESISVKWSNCLAGATGIFKFEGESILPGKRSY